MYDFAAAVYNLQSDTSSLNDKLYSLRFLKQYLDNENNSIDSFNRKRINQLILDNIMKIILSEDKTVNHRKQQLVRTEVFVILASLLNSNVLFGDILGKPDLIADNRLVSLRAISSQNGGHSMSTTQPVQLNAVRSSAPPTTTDSLMKTSSSQKVLPTRADATAVSSADTSALLSASGPVAGKDLSLRLKLLTPALKKHPRSLLSKSLKPRPSVLFSDKLESDSFVPGADPFNFIEQDRKLGYQKPRMWFPAAGVTVDTSMLPGARQGGLSATERIVEEYRQMRALASYVGDLVLPFSGSAGDSTSQDYPSKAKPHSKLNGFNSHQSLVSANTATSRQSGFTDPSKFESAMKEAAAVWTPLLGVHVPPWLSDRYLPRREPKPFKYHSRLRTTGDQDSTTVGSHDDTYTTATGMDASVSSSTQASLAGPALVQADGALKPPGQRSDWVDGDAEEELSSFEQMVRFQAFTQGELRRRKEELAASIHASEQLISATIKAQYALLPSNYIVLLEGGRANSRTLIANTFFIFCRVKRRNLLALALGVWKICLAERESLAKRPRYAKTAALHLMAAWAVRMARRNLKSWVYTWRRAVMLLIFGERSAAAVMLQKTYRTWRDRRRFVQMHLAGTYNGVLSDIQLAPKRQAVLYSVPDTIRDSRRMLWLAAIIVQSKYRCWIESRFYLYKRRQLVLLQSIFRMWPRLCQYRRLKATAIRCQAWARRTVKRVQYKRLRRATVIAQKYVRRYLSWLRLQRMRRADWMATEQTMAAAITIQCRWRIHLAKARAHGVVFRKKMRHYSALVIQRNYYRYKKAFHTFFLMRVLGAREAEDVQLERLSVTMGRRQCARRIQRFYKKRYFRRNITAVIRVQCWFRGRQGYNLVDILRRQRWATRKLHHWARGMIYRRHKLVRKIQRWWWRLQHGRLLSHIWHRMSVADRQEDLELSERRYRAAGRIQAHVKGSWDRRWVRRHRAATKIQRNYRFFRGLRRWRNWKREKILKGVRRFVGSQVERALKKRVKRLVARHALMLTKPQALIRGFLVRCVLIRMRAHAYLLGLASVLIQRFWRKTGAMSRAVEEVMSLRRRENNPFKRCETLHETLLTMRQQCMNYFCSYDPRVGLRVSSFLFRLGCADLAGMFPRKDYVFVADLQGLTLDNLVGMYNAWRAAQQKAKAAGKSKGQAASEEDDLPRNKRPKPPPAQVFQTILDIVDPPFFTRRRSHLEKVQQVLSVQEHLSPSRVMDVCRKVFLKKFGKHLQARAHHVGRDVVELAWGEYNNYKAFGSAALTKAQVVKAIGNATESSHVLSALEELRQMPAAEAGEERRWDRERLSKCADLLQLAVDQAKNVLPSGPLLDLVERAVARVASHRRKMGFIQAKLKKAAALEARRKALPAPKAPAVVASKNHTKSRGHRVPHSSDDHTSLADSSLESESVPGGLRSLHHLDHQNQAVAVGDSVDLPFAGTSEEELELELNAGVCKLYLDLLDRLHTATSGVQSLKNMWNNNAMKRAITAEKLRVFLETATEQYIQAQRTDNVKVVWNRIRKKELAEQKVKVIVQAIRDRQAAVEAELAYIPRFGWQPFEDEYGYQYWADVRPGGSLESSYEVPSYTYVQWRCAAKIQHLARVYLVGAVERHRVREELRQAEMAAATAKLEEEIRQGAKYVSLRLTTRAVAVNVASKHRASREEVAETNPESLLPWKWQFDKSPDLRSGAWALLNQRGADSAADTYDIVMVFKVRPEKRLCDVRTVKGTRIRNVSMGRLFQMNFDIGTAIEARHRGRKMFYRGAICRINDHSAALATFDVLYEDGERECGLARDVVRPSPLALAKFIAARAELLPRCAIQHRRMMHFAAMKRERIAAKTVPGPLPTVATGATEGEDDMSNNPDMPAIEARDSDLASTGVDDGTVISNAEQAASLSAIPVVSAESAMVGQTAVADSVARPPFRMDVRVKIQFSRFPLLCGWAEYSDRTGAIVYANESTGEVRDEKPEYSPKQAYLVRKCQAAWHLYRARKLFRRRVLSLSIESLIQRAVSRGAKIAYVGYGLEGVTAMQMLRRAGCWEMADAMEQFYKASPKLSLAALTFESIMDKTRETFESVGVMMTNHLRDAKELQTWWKRTAPAERERKLSFLNYYSDPLDARSIQQCVLDSEEAISRKFLRVFKTSASRTRAACKSVAEQSLFPHTHLQIETYLRRYSDKPELARESVYEMINKPTTHTWVEERAVYRIYRETARVIAGILNNLKLKRLHRAVRQAENQADALMRDVHDKSRPHCSGVEAKAALLLRTQVFEFLSRYIAAAVVIQRKVRSYHLAREWNVYLASRVRSVNVIQRAIRRTLAFKAARNLRAQQYSEWEQLWDTKRRLLYYYNLATGYSTYEEPDVPFRPLVRDPLSAVLVQAWPQLGSSLAADEAHPNPAGIVSKHAMCCVCNTRKCVRVCYDCRSPDTSAEEAQQRLVSVPGFDPLFVPAPVEQSPYCFTCFTKEHSEESGRLNHSFDVLAESAEQQQLQQQGLMCCMCEEQPATRKCLGAIDADQINAICADLRVTEPDKWISVLQRANVAGDRKISILLDQIRNSDDKQSLAANQLQEVRAVLERTRAECDECYCAPCYKEVHSGGKRANHKWKGFRPNAPVCTVCSNSPAETRCGDCESDYCDSCFQVFHGMGRKRRHKKERVVEALGDGEELCQFCGRRAGSVACTNERCDVRGCDSCLEFVHKARCDRETEAANKRRLNAKLTAGMFQCVMCGDPADKVCIQCGDHYCSKTWMGNPGCFMSYHSKGNRTTHTTENIRYRRK